MAEWQLPDLAFCTGIFTTGHLMTIPADLAALLATIRRPGDFFAAGTAELLAPLIEVEGIGPVALPLLPTQAEQLAAVAEPAPYGRGTETLFVTSVEDNAIKARDLRQGPNASLRTVVQDARLRWPDTFSQAPDGSLYVTTSRIQDSAFFRRDAPLALPTQLWRLNWRHR